MLQNIFRASRSERKVAALLADARACIARQDPAGAQESLNRLLAFAPDHVDALYLLGRVVGQLGACDESAALLEKAVALAPEFGSAFAVLANVYRLQGKNREALRCYRTAIAHGRDAVTLTNLAVLLHELHRHDEAADCLHEALVLQPDFAPAHLNMGLILRMRGSLDAAIACFEHAIELRHGYYDALYNLALALRESGRYDEAETATRRALDVKPDSLEALGTLAIIHSDQGRLDEAIAQLEYVVIRSPADDHATTHLAQARLLEGDFGRGWDEYEKRWGRPTATPRNFPFPRWEGSPLTGQAVLVYGEQGLGDEIMFASCLPDVVARAGRCVVECDRRLVQLFRRSFPGVSVYARSDEGDVAWLKRAEHIDVQVAMGSLPRFFRRTRPDFPNHQGYLKADPARVQFWRDRLAALGEGSKVGISWRGGTRESRASLRSIPLLDWTQLLATANTHFISLQYTACEDELTRLHAEKGIQVHHWREALDDYDETAALVCALDLTVSVCTSVVSLAGALGRPVWVLVPYSPGWLFQREGDTMPWFPAATLFRQPQPADWSSVLDAVRSRLTGLPVATVREARR